MSKKQKEKKKFRFEVLRAHRNRDGERERGKKKKKKMEAPKQLSAESQSIFREGIGLVLSQWSALRMAVENEWGGRDSRSKAEQLGSDIFSWFTQSKEPLYIDDLENMLDEGIESAFNAILDDGSVEEVAEKLMIMHEECLDGNFSSIGSLRETSRKRVAHPHVRQVKFLHDLNLMDLMVLNFL
ncbi:hypothetical protein FEM48_Zijuj02G0158000 [Ziziphus jujuba var. spinosa]|uniref:Pre-rRNA-processing protein TSR2 homolog n=1 Tax=Ziziphus jujuba var. spinosa TaxID=714518 RepID=A0A978VWK0_ZIZJJ|nr:hypothetical protein FEM48_Zijuj02G0158000 [Ziziphus jujuba var. spinosa]